MRVCTICLKEKALTEFAKSKTGKHGRRSQCKTCINRRQQAARVWRGPTGTIPYGVFNEISS